MTKYPGPSANLLRDLVLIWPAQLDGDICDRITRRTNGRWLTGTVERFLVQVSITHWLAQKAIHLRVGATWDLVVISDFIDDEREIQWPAACYGRTGIVIGADTVVLAERNIVDIPRSSLQIVRLPTRRKILVFWNLGMKLISANEG